MKAPKGSPLDKALKRHTLTCFVGLLITIATWSVYFVLYGIGVGEVLNFVGIVALIFTTMTIVAPFGKKDIKRQYCLSCGQKYDYDSINWEVIEEINSGTKLEEVVEFDCECEECGDSRTFTKKFTVATIDSKGNIKRQNLDKLIAKYFGKM